MSSNIVRSSNGTTVQAAAVTDRKADGAKKQTECSTCGVERVPNQFPGDNPSSECEHFINTCKGCLGAWIAIQVQENLLTVVGEEGKALGIACPECAAVMKNHNIKIAASGEVFRRYVAFSISTTNDRDSADRFDRFEELERRHIAELTPGWRRCLAPSCNSGQVHTKPAALKTLQSEAGEPDIFTCKECGARACVACDRPWHEGEICANYQSRIKGRVEEEDKSLMKIKKETKPCPGCHANVERNGGCAHIRCEFSFKIDLRTLEAAVTDIKLFRLLRCKLLLGVSPHFQGSSLRL